MARFPRNCRIAQLVALAIAALIGVCGCSNGKAWSFNLTGLTITSEGEAEDAVMDDPSADDDAEPGDDD